MPCPPVSLGAATPGVACPLTPRDARSHTSDVRVKAHNVAGGRWLSTWLALMAISVALGACGSSGAARTSDIRGVFGVAGGVYPGTFHPDQGRIHFKGEGRESGNHYSIKTTRDGRFNIRVVPGEYCVYGTSPKLSPEPGCDHIYTRAHKSQFVHIEYELM